MKVAPGTRLGPYEIVSRIGAGGMGEVWRARDTRLDRSVAVKVLLGEYATNPHLKIRFEREARAISQLNHPNICTLHDVGEGYLVMELIEGESLAQRITRGPLPVTEVLEYGAQVAGALDRAHRAGIVHRDLKPGNVMITRSGLKLLDFGLARITETSSSTSDAPTALNPVTTEGTIIGTLQYMSPEQLEGKSTDARTDVFALGCMLYEMLTGHRAFEGSNQASLISAIMNSEPRPLSESHPLTPRALERLTVRCMAKDADKRWQCAADIAFELRLLADGSPENGPAETEQPSTRQLRRWKYGTAALTLLLLAALGTAAWIGRYALGLAKPAAAPLPELVPLTWEPGGEWTPSISPDGASFVYASARAEDSSNAQSAIFLRRVGGENPVNLTKDSPASNREPAFSPDGQSIAFRSERDGGGIFIMGATGESVTRLTDFGRDPAWSPDGKAIAFATLPSNVLNDQTGEIWVVDVASGIRKKILSGHGLKPSWSPSGARIAFMGKGRSAAGRRAIWTIPPTGGEPVEVSSMPDLTLLRIDWVGEWLWFTHAAGGPPGLWRMRVGENSGARLSTPEPVLRSATVVLDISASRDGKRVLFSSGFPKSTVLRWAFDPARGRVSSEASAILSGTRGISLWGPPSPDGEWLTTRVVDWFRPLHEAILLVRASTGETRRLTNDTLSEGAASAWSPDGSKLYFSVAPAGKREVWSIHTDGSGRELVATSSSAGDIDYPLASPDGKELYVLLGEKTWKPYKVDLSVPIAQRRLTPLPAVSETRNFDYLAWSPDGRWILGYPADDEGNEDPVLIIFDVARKTYRKLSDLKPGFAVGWLPDSRRILLNSNGDLQVLDRETGVIAAAGSVGKGVSALKISSDGRTLFGFRQAHEFDIWMLDYGVKP